MIASSYALPPILPPAAHPRLMLTARDLPRIRENLCGGQYPDATGLFRQLCDVEIKGVGATPEAGTYHMKEYLALEAKALDALLSDRSKCVLRLVMLLSDGTANEWEFYPVSANRVVVKVKNGAYAAEGARFVIYGTALADITNAYLHLMEGEEFHYEQRYDD